MRNLIGLRWDELTKEEEDMLTNMDVYSYLDDDDQNCTIYFGDNLAIHGYYTDEDEITVNKYATIFNPNN